MAFLNPLPVEMARIMIRMPKEIAQMEILSTGFATLRVAERLRIIRWAINNSNFKRNAAIENGLQIYYNACASAGKFTNKSPRGASF